MGKRREADCDEGGEGTGGEATGDEKDPTGGQGRGARGARPSPRVKAGRIAVLYYVAPALARRYRVLAAELDVAASDLVESAMAAHLPGLEQQAAARREEEGTLADAEIQRLASLVTGRPAAEGDPTDPATAPAQGPGRRRRSK